MDAAPDIDSVAGESVVVIGGGFGGLSTACYLADAGADVTLLEKNEQLGGRASRLEADGFKFDMGPSWYLMPDVFERFFGHFGRSPEEYYTLSHLDPHYRVFWKDGDQVDVLPDMDHNRELFESYEPGAGDTLDEYLAESKRTYEIGMEHFVYEDRPNLRDYVDTDVLRYSWGLSLLGKMQGHVEGYFDHPKLQQLMQYTLVFLGGSPTNTPALYNLMSHVDFNMGVYYPDGGIGAVVDGIVELGDELGVEYVTDAEVTAIEGRYGAFAVDTAGSDSEGGTGGESGERYLADIVVSNADYAYTEQALLPEKKRQYTEEYWESRTYAPSAFLLYLGVEGDVPNLEHHTLVLPTEWNQHFDQIFEEPAWPDDPGVLPLCPLEDGRHGRPGGPQQPVRAGPHRARIGGHARAARGVPRGRPRRHRREHGRGAPRPDRLRGDVLRRGLRRPLQQLSGQRAGAGAHAPADIAAPPPTPVGDRGRALLHRVDDDARDRRPDVSHKRGHHGRTGRGHDLNT